MTDITQQGEVLIQDFEGGIRRIMFAHPAHNSMPSPLLKKLAETIKQSGESDDIKVLILESKGDRTFCAGASFDELISIENLDQGKAFFMGFAHVINACRKCPKLIIGRVQGKAVGGGVGLASAVDYCLATKFASVKLSELALGIGPFVVGPAVERKIGLSAMSQLAINATEWKSADWALQKGLYAGVFEDNAAMDIELNKLAMRLSSFSLQAMRDLKSVLWQEAKDWDRLLEERAMISGRLILSEESKSALEQIKSKV